MFLICYGDAKQRIKEIEEGLKREVIETIQDPIEILNHILNVINSAIEEIDIIMSTANTFKRYEREGITELLTKKAVEGVKVRMLLNQNQDIKQSIERLKINPQITIKNLDKSVQTKVTTIVADNELSLVIELKDDAKQNSDEAIGLATYSNSESTVLSYASIFETLWIQSSGYYDMMVNSQPFYLLCRIDPYYLLAFHFLVGADSAQTNKTLLVRSHRPTSNFGDC